MAIVSIDNGGEMWRSAKISAKGENEKLAG
jgi:hypothetical protein